MKLASFFALIFQWSSGPEDSGAIKIGHIIGPNSIIVEQFVLILAKYFLNSIIERRKSTRIYESTWEIFRKNTE